MDKNKSMKDEKGGSRDHKDRNKTLGRPQRPPAQPKDYEEIEY